MRIGPGGFLLPYHHPAELANRVAMLDHLSEGRLNFGVAAQRPAERLGDVQRRRHERAEPRHDPRGAGDHPEALVDPAPFTYKGKFWTVTKPDTMFDFLKPHIKPLQAPHPPIGVAGLLEELGHAEARRRARLHSDEPQPQPGLCRQPLGLGGDRRRQDRAQAEPPGTGGWCARCSSPTPTRRPGSSSTGDMMGRMMQRVLPAAARPFRLQGLSEACPRRARQRRHRRILRQAELDRRLARDRRREDRKDLRRGRRLRRAAACSASTTSTSPKLGTTRSRCSRTR